VNFLRRFIFFVSLGTFVVSIVLLLNFTASNPTGRRYSSEIPTGTRRTEAGYDAERILSLDLGVPHNNSSLRQCICGTEASDNPRDHNCNVCTVISNDMSVGEAHLPDFVTDSYIAEAKNYSPNTNIYSNNREQLDAFIAMAEYLNRPLWLYVAVDSRVSPELQYLVEETGGGVVFYFTVPNYVDPVDEGARKAALGSMFIMGVFVMTEISERKRLYRKAAQSAASRAHQSTETAEDFARRSKERIKIQLESDDE
jgi:hypothetical protein